MSDTKIQHRGNVEISAFLLFNICAPPAASFPLFLKVMNLCPPLPEPCDKVFRTDVRMLSKCQSTTLQSSSPPNCRRSLDTAGTYQRKFRKKQRGAEGTASPKLLNACTLAKLRAQNDLLPHSDPYPKSIGRNRRNTCAAIGGTRDGQSRARLQQWVLA